jgi:quinol-cytochrome oxidoreductase complex cytochrome b subunit
VSDGNALFILNQSKENDMNRNLLTTIFKAVALGMGVAVIVLNVLGTLTVETAVSMLSIGLTALALAGLQKE